MDLAALVQSRPVPGAGLLLTVTARCPLRCAHCSTASTMESSEPDPGQLLRFVDSFTELDRPDVVLMTGGEPLLRPELVTELAQAARRAGSRPAVLSGAFFARHDRIPAHILRAVRAVDHFSVSVDAFHERQVHRADVFRTLRQVLDCGIPVSIHATGIGPDDPYLAELVAATRRAFGGDVPMLVNTIRPFGRAAGWLAATAPPVDGRRVLPCAMAAWPVVAHDGVILACCNQDAVNGRPVPPHLSLGHIESDDWPTVLRRTLSSPVLRMIRATGPAYLIARYGEPTPDHGYCDGCRRLGERPEVVDALQAVASGPVGAMLDRQAARMQYESGPVDFVRRHGCARYADLVASASDGRRT